MSGTRVTILRVRGIPISVDASWLIILTLVTWSLRDTFAQEIPDLPEGAYWGIGLGSALAFFVCIVLHELGHAVVAATTGTPVRGITLFLFGGVAEMGDEPKSAGNEFLMAVAGPAVSGVLALGFAVLSPFVPPAVGVPLAHLAGINLAVLVFNLVPAFPLDGGRVLRSFLWSVTGDLRRATRWASVGGRLFAALLIGLGLVNLLAGQVTAGIWLGLIGWFLHTAARGSYDQVLLRQALTGEPIRRFFSADTACVPPTIDLRSWVDDYVYRHHRTEFPVVSDGVLVGVIGTRDLAPFPAEEWPTLTVKEVMRRDWQPAAISPGADALSALDQMRSAGADRLYVVDHNRFVGTVGLGDLLSFLSLKLQLGDERR